MKILAVILNIVLFGFTCLVLITDGVSREFSYNIFALLLLLVPILNVAVFSQRGVGGSWFGFHPTSKESGVRKMVGPSIGTVMKKAAIVSNIVLFGFACWAIMSQYPHHPKEEGLIEFTVMVLLTPILSTLVLFRRGPLPFKETLQ